jgi:uncharacterized protein (DUF1800 family)
VAERIDRSFAYFVLGRAAFGADARSLEQLTEQGLPAWLDEQLKPRAEGDGQLSLKLREARLRIKYPAGEGWAALDEARPLTSLDAPISTLWHLTDRKVPVHPLERRRPRDEVMAATLLRAVHSHWQLREVMCSFWHDHFNVDAAGSEVIGIALPAYDRDAIRQHALGNFREFLEAVARSTAMQYYLSNRSSRAGAANENFARELFELHTLGRGAYLNDQYDRWREVPGALEGQPQGYIDQDVYEAARAFTGWTVEDGSGIDAHRKLPLTGQFAYVENWHDGYQKRVLATEFDAFAPALGDGRRVLDLLAAHPATARFICTKLCRRFLGETVPPALRERLSAVWLRHVESHDQIAQVLRVLLLSPEFAHAQGAAHGKLRRPLALAAGFARALDIDLSYAEPLGAELAAAGQPLFGWPTPTGLPDTAAPFLTSQALRHRWSLLLSLADNSWNTGAPAAPAALGLGDPTTAVAVAALLTRLTGGARAASRAAIVEGCGFAADQPLAAAGAAEAARRWARLAAYAGMSLEFQCV